MKKLKLEGKRFGENLVITRDPKNSRKWLCRCSCGFERSILGQSLIRGESTCCRKCQFKKQVLKDCLPRTIWSRIRINAKQRKLPVTLTRQQAYDLFLQQRKCCKLSGLPISLSFDENRLVSASLDRIDSSQGYTLQNVQWVHKDINMMKQALKQQRFIELCAKVSKKQNDRNPQSAGS